MATPLYVFWPYTATLYPAALTASKGNCSSVAFSSCRQRTSGCREVSQARNRSWRALIELTFQLARSMGEKLQPRRGAGFTSA